MLKSQDGWFFIENIEYVYQVERFGISTIP